MLERLWLWLQRVLGRSDIYAGSSLYMRRWLVGPKWGPGLRLHHIARGDATPEMHDHPFSFLSFVLWGGYVEHRPDRQPRTVRPWSFVFHRAEDLHRLELDRTAWTFVIRGPIRRTWGFMTAEGWVPWREFVQARDAELGAGEPGAFAAVSSLGLRRGGEP